MIFQNPGASLNPVIRVGNQLTEAMALHLGRAARRRAGARSTSLTRVGIPAAAPRARLSASVLRRHGPAGDDRHGARLPARAADRGRADDRARRHHPGADARADPPARRASSAWRCCSSPTTSASSRRCADRVVVMYAGRIVEEAPVSTRVPRPRGTRTRGADRAACPGSTRDRLGAIPGVMPGLKAFPPRLRFHPRCRVADARLRHRGRPSGARSGPITSRRLPPGGSAMTAAAQRRGPRQALRAARRLLARALGGGGSSARSTASASRSPRRDARPRRRERVRQDDHRPARPARHRADGRAHRLRRRGRHGAAGGAAPAVSARRCRSCSRIPTRR